VILAVVSDDLLCFFGVRCVRVLRAGCLLSFSMRDVFLSIAGMVPSKLIWEWSVAG